MKTKKNAIWTVLLIPALILAACQPAAPVEPIPDDPVEAIVLILERQEEITSLHLDLNGSATIDIKGDDPSLAFFNDLEIAAEASADINQNSEFQISGSLDLGPLTAFLAAGEDKIEFEARLVGDTMYTKALGQDWSELPTDGAFDIGSDAASQVSPAQLAQAIETFGNTERLSDENIDGTDTYHFKVSMDSDTLLNFAALSPDADSAQLELARQVLQNSAFDVEIWASKENLLIRQQKLHILLDLSDLSGLAAATGTPAPEIDSFLFDMDIVVKFSRINEEINISAP